MVRVRASLTRSPFSGYTFNIFLEYVAGGSIASIIDRFGPIKENLTRLYTKQILSGLDYIHRRQIVHCDIKGNLPSLTALTFSGANILIDNKGVIKLTDFGASKSLESVTAHKGFNSLRGTVSVARGTIFIWLGLLDGSRGDTTKWLWS